MLIIYTDKTHILTNLTYRANGNKLWYIIQLLTYVEVDMECYWTVNVILTDAERRSIWLSLLFNNTPCLTKHKSTIVLLYYKCMLCISCHFGPLKRWRYGWIMRNDVTLWRHFPYASQYYLVSMCFATSRPANHVICSFIDSSGYASGPIRRCLFIDYIITDNNSQLKYAITDVTGKLRHSRR